MLLQEIKQGESKILEFKEMLPSDSKKYVKTVMGLYILFTIIAPFIENSDILLLQYKYLSEKSEFKGFSLYSYSYCFGENLTDNTIKEINGLTSML